MSSASTRWKTTLPDVVNSRFQCYYSHQAMLNGSEIIAHLTQTLSIFKLYLDLIKNFKSIFDRFVIFYNFYLPQFLLTTFISGLEWINLYNAYQLFHQHICQVCGSFQCPYCPYYNAGNSNGSSQLPIIVALISMLISILIRHLLTLWWNSSYKQPL